MASTTGISAADNPMPQRICLGCDEPIPLRRLQAKPNAVYCVPCQEKIGDVPPIKGDTIYHRAYTQGGVSFNTAPDEVAPRYRSPHLHTISWDEVENLSNEPEG